MKILVKILFFFCVISSPLYAHSLGGHRKDIVNVFEGIQGKNFDTTYKIISSGIDSEHFKLNGQYCKKYSFVRDFHKKFGSLPKGNHRLIGHWGFEGAIPFNREPYKTALSPYPKTEVIKLWKTYVNKVTHKIAALTGLPIKQARALGGIIYDIHLLGDYSTVYTEPLPPPQYIEKDIIKNLNRLLGNNNKLTQIVNNELKMLDPHLSSAEYANKVQEILERNNIGEKFFKKYSQELTPQKITRITNDSYSSGIKNSFNKLGSSINTPQKTSIFSDSLQALREPLPKPRENWSNNTKSNRNRLGQHPSQIGKNIVSLGTKGIFVLEAGISIYQIGSAVYLYNKGEISQTEMLVKIGSNSSTLLGMGVGFLINGFPGAIMGGGIAISIYQIGSAVYLYNKGEISQTEMLVKIGSNSALLVGCLWGGPVGIGIAVIYFAGDFTYNYYANKQRQENILFEIRHRAEWETENNRMRFQKTISDLIKSSEQMRLEAWKGLG